jgi:hypothetical protein
MSNVLGTTAFVGADKRKLEELDDTEITDSLETNGSLLVYDAAHTVWDAIPAGADGNVLVADSTQPFGLKYEAVTASFPAEPANTALMGPLAGAPAAPTFRAINSQLDLGAPRVLSDATPQPSIDWGQRFLFDSAGVKAADYQNRLLLASDGVTHQLSYGVGGPIIGDTTANVGLQVGMAGPSTASLVAANAGADVGLTVVTKGKGNVAFTASGNGPLLTLVQPVATPSVNNISIGSNLTGFDPFIRAGGTDPNVNLSLMGQGTGTVKMNGLLYPLADGTAGQVLKTNGAATLSFGYPAGTRVASGSLTAAQINGMFAAPVQLIAPAGENTAIILLDSTLGPMKGTVYTLGGTILFTTAVGAVNVASVSATVLTTGNLYGKMNQLGTTFPVADVENVGIQITNQTVPFVGGDGTSNVPWMVRYILLNNGVPV